MNSDIQDYVHLVNWKGWVNSPDLMTHLAYNLGYVKLTDRDDTTIMHFYRNSNAVYHLVKPEYEYVFELDWTGDRFITCISSTLGEWYINDFNNDFSLLNSEFIRLRNEMPRDLFVDLFSNDIARLG